LITPAPSPHSPLDWSKVSKKTTGDTAHHL
jgi:hypothetical protein